ncbi:MAG TPA: zf-HC2 domain-containing protein [Thermoanaerobaculia bacterium]|nr:zf-HC2 domain-containing protein [Thermoanaerobaculia bacterium]
MNDGTDRIDGGRARRRTGHEEAWDLLPWFVNRTLDEGELRAVEEHLEGCGICREEVRYLGGFAETLRDEGDLAVGADAGLERVRGRLGAAGAGGRSAGRGRRWVAGFRRAPAPLRWALAAQLVVILGLTGLVAGPLLEGPGGSSTGAAAASGLPEPAPAGPFRTLSEAPEPDAAAGDAALLRVVFAERAREREIRGALISVGGRIVDGPSPTGVYSVAVDGAAEGAAAMATLRSLPQVLFAERAATSPGEGR